jgi:serine/threonine-protein kinase
VTSFQPGDLIGGRYRLREIIGVGAMGVVWSARNESTERDFALKLMLPDASRDPQRVARFFQEARVAGRLRHRAIVEVYDVGRLDDDPHAGAPYLVMELLEGEPLDALLRRVGKLPAGTALRIVRDVARGLEVAHRSGVIHRDLKPANVFLHRADGVTVPKILDFGISKLVPGPAEIRLRAQETTVGTILGSPAYMSPEQTSGEDLDPRADLWSLGVVLYKVLAGELPFDAPNFTKLMLAINTADPAPLEEHAPGLPAEVYAVVARCLSRRRGDRHPRAGLLADEIDAILGRHDLPTLDLSQLIAIGGKETARASSEVVEADAFEGTRRLEESAPSRALSGIATPHPVTSSNDLEATGAHGTIVTRDPIERPRRRLGALVAIAAAALIVSGVWVRGRGPKAVPTVGAGRASAPSAEPVPAVASAQPESSPPATEPSRDDHTEPARRERPREPVRPARPAPKRAPTPKPAPTAAPHEGLVRPGF